MMKYLWISATLVVAAGSSASAQGKDQPDAQCVSTSTNQTDSRRVLQDACQKSVDLFSYMAPQLSAAIAGGNATLGQPGSQGGLGHFSIGFRATAVQGSLPQFNRASRPDTGAARVTAYRTKESPVPMAAVDLSIGLFKGIPLGVASLGGLDLLLSGSYVPEYGDEGDDLVIKAPDGSLKVGYGARLGILNEGAVMPGISVSYLMRGLPKLDVTATMKDETDPSLSDSIYIRGFEMNTTSWRIVASKKLLFLGLAAGYGQDTYDSKADIGAAVTETFLIIGRQTFSTDPDPLATFEQKVTRSNIFANVSLNLMILKLTAEVGQVSGGEITTYNHYFDEEGTKAVPPDKSRMYGSVGFRIGF